MSDALSRAKRNNSPVNMTPLALPAKWGGQVNVVDGYAVFDTEVNGWRAGALNLMAYQRDHGINTLVGIANRWAPSPDGTALNLGNNPSAYATNVSKASGIPVDQVLNLFDEATMLKVLAGMAVAEDSRVIWDPAKLKLGVDQALVVSGHPSAPPVVLVIPVTQPVLPVVIETTLGTSADAYHLWLAEVLGDSQVVFTAGWQAALKSRGLT